MLPLISSFGRTFIDHFILCRSLYLLLFRLKYFCFHGHVVLFPATAVSKRNPSLSFLLFFRGEEGGLESYSFRIFLM